MKDSELLFGLMASFNKTEYSIGDFNHLIKPFNVTEISLRTNLSRMKKKKLIQPRKDGKKVYYSFGKKGSRIKKNVAMGFSKLDWDSWDKKWWGIIFSFPRDDKEQRYKVRKKLSLYRFASLFPGFWIRPFHPDEKIEKKLQDIFNDKYCKAIKFNHYKELSKDEVNKLWDLNNINKEFKNGLELIYEKKKELNNITPEKALFEKMSIGDQLVKKLFLDPLLPDIFLSDNWRGDELKKEFFVLDKKLTEISKPYWHLIFQ